MGASNFELGLGGGYNNLFSSGKGNKIDKKTKSRPAAAPERKIERLRAEIDAADTGIVALLNRRARLAQEIGAVKRALAREKTYYIPAREEEILERLERRTRARSRATPSGRSSARSSPRAASLEKRLKVAYLRAGGELHPHRRRGSSSGTPPEFLPERSVTDVFEEVGARARGLRRGADRELDRGRGHPYPRHVPRLGADHLRARSCWRSGTTCSPWTAT